MGTSNEVSPISGPLPALHEPLGLADRLVAEATSGAFSDQREVDAAIAAVLRLWLADDAI